MAKILSIFNLSQFTDQSLKNNMSNRKMFHSLLLVHNKYVFNVILVVATRLAITFVVDLSWLFVVMISFQFQLYD